MSYQHQDQEALITFRDGRQLSIRESDIAAIQTYQPTARIARPQQNDIGAIRNQQINQAHTTFFAIGAVFCFGIVGFLLLASIAKFLAAPTIVQPPPVEVRCPVFGTCNVK